jgi:hypothetical protein
MKCQSASSSEKTNQSNKRRTPLCLCASPQTSSGIEVVICFQRCSPPKKKVKQSWHADTRIPLENTAAAARRRRKSHKEQHEPFMFLAFHIVIVHPSSALEAVHVVSRLAAEVLRWLLMMLHAEALRLAYVHTADHAAHVGV